MYRIFNNQYLRSAHVQGSRGSSGSGNNSWIYFYLNNSNTINNNNNIMVIRWQPFFYYLSRKFLQTTPTTTTPTTVTTMDSLNSDKLSAPLSNNKSTSNVSSQTIVSKKPNNGRTSRVKSMISTSKRTRKVDPSGRIEEVTLNKEEIQRSIKTGASEVKTRSFEESVHRKDVQMENDTRGIHERRMDRSHRLVSFTEGEDHEESDEKTQSKTTETVVTELLDKDGNIQQRTTQRYHHPPEESAASANEDTDENKRAKDNNENKSSKDSKNKNKNKNNGNSKNGNSTNNSNNSKSNSNGNSNVSNSDNHQKSKLYEAKIDSKDNNQVENSNIEEMIGKKPQLTLQKLMIHKNQLLSMSQKSFAIEKEEGYENENRDNEEVNINKSVRHMACFVKDFSQRIKRKTIGGQKWEQITDRFQIKYTKVQTI